MGNNLVGWKTIEWLKKEGENIVGLIVHPPEKQKFTSEIIETANLTDDEIFLGSELSNPKIRKRIISLSPDIGVSVFFDYILKPEMFCNIPHGVINLHPALLPYNRGQYPNVWSIVDGTPSGVTLHYIDEKIDTGDIIAQREIQVEPVDTGKSLYRKLESASIDLFRSEWPNIKSGKNNRQPQQEVAGTYHRTKDVEKIDRIDPEKKYTAKHLIDVLRARSFPPYKGAYITADGKKIYLTLKLEWGGDE
jgi:methionyl-tRNA formyltransferase